VSIYLNFPKQRQMLDYHPAWEMMHEALGGVQRFLGNDQVPADKKETVKAHVESVNTRGYELFKQTEKDLGKFLFSDSKHFTHLNLVHDWGEIVVEPMIAYGEMDPDLQAALSNYPAAEIEGQIARHFYRHALAMSYAGEPDKFYKYVEDARRDTVPDAHASGKMQAPEVLQFYQDITFMMRNTEMAMPQLNPYWNDPTVNRQVELMHGYYNEIEGQASFIGTWAKTLEKMDGTAYICDTRQQQGLGGLDARLENRIVGRYEGCFHTLLRNAGKKRGHQLLATNLILNAYEISLRNMQQHEGEILLDGMEQSIDCKQAVTLYGEKLDELRSTRNLILRPDQFAPKETLLQRHCRTA
jgi:hypothetical protein